MDEWKKEEKDYSGHTAPYLVMYASKSPGEERINASPARTNLQLPVLGNHIFSRTAKTSDATMTVS